MNLNKNYLIRKIINTSPLLSGARADSDPDSKETLGHITTRDAVQIVFYFQCFMLHAIHIV